MIYLAIKHTASLYLKLRPWVTKLVKCGWVGDSKNTFTSWVHFWREKILGEIAKCKAMEKVASQKEVYKKSALICKEAVWFFCSK